MDRHTVKISYSYSFLWVGLLVALICGISNIVELIFVDFIHGNPHRSQSNAIFMMIFYTPLFGVMGIIGTIIVFAMSQLFQAVLMIVLIGRFGRKARFLVLATLPLAAAITYYCFDYLTPSDWGANGDADWVPYQHGITVNRYLAALALQIPIAIFSFFYFDSELRGYSKKPIISISLGVAIVVGVVLGHHMAKVQFQFL